MIGCGCMTKENEKIQFEIAKFSSGSKDIRLSSESYMLDNVSLMTTHTLEIKYPETYAEESLRGKVIQRFDWANKGLFTGEVDQTNESDAKELFFAWVERELGYPMPKYYEVWYQSLPKEEKAKYNPTAFDWKVR